MIAAETTDIPAGRWLALTLGSLIVLMLVSIGVAYRMDVFGIFRDPRGRLLVTSEHERKAKFLLNQAYVPTNFDALVIGASTSVNWRLDQFTGYRFYNESLEGGDASEERKLVEQALPKGHFKVALVGLYPRITGLHVLQDGFDTATHTEALGSISAYSVEFEALLDRLQHRTSAFSPNGSHTFPPRQPPPYHHNWQDEVIGDQDPLSVADYQALVRELLQGGTRVIYVVSPIFNDALMQNQRVMDEYRAQVSATMPAAPMIDFNLPEYTDFRQDQDNFTDALHLSSAGSERLSRLLNVRIQQILAEK